MRKIWKRIFSFVVTVAMLIPMAACIVMPPTSSSPFSSTNEESSKPSKDSSTGSTNKDSTGNTSTGSSSDSSSSSSGGGGGGQTVDVSGNIVRKKDISYRLQYDEQAPFENECSPTASMMSGHDIGWQNWSLPIGNGYFGANVFGRTESERIQITEKTLSNPWQYVYQHDGVTDYPAIAGLNNFSETYIDFHHKNSSVTNYNRYLDLATAISGVSYNYNGVTYTREYFTSYPDKALVIRLDASANGALGFTLRPTVPFEQTHMNPTYKDGYSKSGQVVSSVQNGVGCIELTGKLGFYDVDFVGYYRVYTNGGTVKASTTQHTYKDTDGTSHTDTDGTIVVSGAKSAYIVVTLGTDYELSSELFTTGQFDRNKPTNKTTLADAKAKVNEYLTPITNVLASRDFESGYTYLKNRHIGDYQELYGRVDVDLGINEDDLSRTTDSLLARYNAGLKSTYLEGLLLQYGRYLLIASSRPGTLPANLQGAWNCYNTPAWSSGYWNNINVQMNYWHAFSTNIAETFESYVEYNKAYMKAAQNNASWSVETYNPDMYNKDGGNGWTLSVASNPFFLNGDRSCGNMGFTTQVFYDYYQYTKDPEVLSLVYDLMADAAKYVTKCVKKYGDKYLVEHCDSPEVYVNGVWYYTTGTTYAQSLAYLNNYAVLEMAKDLGIDLEDATELSQADKTILKTILEQIDAYDPINVGLSGQVKEFREEDYYGSLGNPVHRHISQLVGLFPGNLINDSTPAWMDASVVSLEGRLNGLEDWTGDWSRYDQSEASMVGWSWVHKAALYARAGEGDRARDMIAGTLKGATLENLLMTCGKVFQIEASCGTSAALAEMLLQSDDPYLEPLPAMPSAWTSGSYVGLMARGNFEVSAEWKDGLAKNFNILSNKGGALSVKYPSITQAKVYTSAGKPVSYKITANDIITFETTAGETYIITGFVKQERPEKPADFNVRRTGLGEFNLTWTKVSSAAKYNVYVAIENSPTYKLLGTVTTNSFDAVLDMSEANLRKTFVVTAVNANGVESKRALCYSNPVDSDVELYGASWKVVASGELQVIVDANDNAGKFILWEKAKGATEYSIVDQSKFPLLATKYNIDSDYAVSVLSIYDGSETELYVLEPNYDVNNILAGKKFIPTEEALSGIYSDNYGYDTLTDGINFTESSGRFSTKVGSGTVNAIVDLEGSYILSEFRIYDYKKNVAFAGNSLKIEALHKGLWTTVVNCTNNAAIAAHRVNGSGDVAWLAFGVEGVQAEKLRLIIGGCTSSSVSVSIYEVQCSGVRDENAVDGYSNVFLGKTITPSADAAANAFNADYGYNALVDGIVYEESRGRYSSSENGGKVEATIELNGTHNLEELKLYVYNNEIQKAGDGLKVQVYYDGVWTTVVNCASNAELSNYLVKNTTGIGFDWLVFYLGDVYAEKVKFTTTTKTGLGQGWVTLYEMECRGIAVDGSISTNVLSGKQFVPASGISNGPGWAGWGGYETLTDGILEEVNGRFTTPFAAAADATVDLGGVYELYDLRFYVFNGQLVSAGTDMLVEIYYNGNWTTVVNCADNAAIGNYIVTNDGTSITGFNWIGFNLNGAKAEKIRFYVSNTMPDQTTTYYEVTCSGRQLEKVTTNPNENTSVNAFQNASATVTTGTASVGNPISMAFDGSQSTYAKVTGVNGAYSVEINLGRPRALYTLTISELIGSTNLVGGVLATASNATKIEVYVDGTWLTIANNVALNANGTTTFNMLGVEACKVRITFKNTRTFDGQSGYECAVIKEISCTAGYEAVDRSALIAALNSLTFANESSFNYVFDQDYIKFKAYATSVDATQAQIDAYVQDIKNR